MLSTLAEWDCNAMLNNGMSIFFLSSFFFFFQFGFPEP